MVRGICRWTERHPWWSAAAVLLLVACAWFPALLKGHQLGQSYVLYNDPPFAAAAPPAETLPHRTVFTDAARQFHPWDVVARGQLGEGHLPLWNEYEYGGQPLLANMQSALLFPLTWIDMVVGPDYGAGLVAIAKLLLAGLGAFALTRQLGVRRWGAGVVAGTVYMLAAPLIVWLQAPAGSVFAIYPWLLAATHWLATRGSPRAAAAVAAATTLTILAGHPESSLAAISGAAIYIAVLLAFRARADLRGVVSLGTRWLLAASLGLAGAAVVVLPFEGFLADSVTKATHGSTAPIPFYAALQFLAPHLFGNAQPHTYGFTFSLTPVAGYFGVPALMLAIAALWRHRRAPAAAALAATALAAAMATFGIPPVSWWTEHVPPWSDALMAGRVYFMVALAAAVGAGAGYAALSDRGMRPRGVAIVGLGVAAVTLLGFAIAQARGLLEAPAPVRRDALLLAGVAIAAGSALLAGLGRLRAPVMLAATLLIAAVSVIELRGYNVVLDPALAHPETPPSVRFLQAREWPFRVQVIREGGNMLNPNILAEHGLESLEGYDFPLDGRWSDFQAGALRYGGLLPERRVMLGPPEGAALTALRLFNVRYYVGEPGASPPKGFETVYDDADATVFRDPGALPRAFVVPATRSLSDDAALRELGRTGFDPRREALVADGSTAPAPTGAYTPARVERLAPDHLRVHLGGTPGWLVVGNAYSEFWEAKVDGESADLHPTDFAAMGLPVTATAKTVDIELDRTRPAIGALISLLALAGMGVLAFRRQR